MLKEKEMCKKSILIIMPYLNCGGVESTLLSMLEIINKEKYEITLLLLEKKGEFIKRIPPQITVKEIELPEKEKGIFYGKKKMLLHYLKKGHIHKIPRYLLYNRKNGLTENRENNAMYFRRISSSIPVLDGEYDLAIDYFGYATFTTFYLAEKVQAKKKVSWLHSILSRFQPQSFEEWYREMDAIFACSKMVKKDFENVFPGINTVQTFYNIIHPKEICRMAQIQDGFEDKFEGIRILTVGRICYEKGIDLAIEAYKGLIESGYKVRWYLIGGGSTEDYQKFYGMLETDKEKDNFIFLGTKDNPYVYMKQCDIYVQPSRFEGYCTTTNEARIIGCPIVMTNVSGAEEQIEDGVTGYIVEQRGKSIFEGIEKLINNSEIRMNFCENIKKIEVDTVHEIAKLYALLDEGD